VRPRANGCMVRRSTNKLPFIANRYSKQTWPRFVPFLRFLRMYTSKQIAVETAFMRSSWRINRGGGAWPETTIARLFGVFDEAPPPFHSPSGMSRQTNVIRFKLSSWRISSPPNSRTAQAVSRKAGRSVQCGVVPDASLHESS